jgi:hypothetical protein
MFCVWKEKNRGSSGCDARATVEHGKIAFWTEGSRAGKSQLKRPTAGLGGIEKKNLTAKVLIVQADRLGSRDNCSSSTTH